MKDLACCLTLLNISTLDFTSDMQDMKVKIRCFQLCNDFGPDDVTIYECADCSNADDARAYVRTHDKHWDDNMNDYLNSEEFLEALKACIGASDNSMGKVI